MRVEAKRLAVASIAFIFLAFAACNDSVDPVRESPSSRGQARQRHVPLEGQPNFRDIGGYEAVDGRTLKWGQAYRTSVEAFFVLDGSYIDGTLERAIEDYGSMVGYIREGLGLEDEEIGLLRSQLLDPARE